MNTDQMTEEVATQTQELKEKAGEWKNNIQGAARDAGAAADLYLHEYAWTTVAVVGVAAGLVGFLIGRSQSKL